MEELFGSLSRAVEGSPGVALGASFVWGILSVILSPCHLASIPLIVGFINQQGRMSTGRAFMVSSLFAGGILITIAAIGAITAAAGRMMGDIGAWGNYLVAGIFFLVGLHLLDVIPMPFSGPGRVGMRRKGLLAAFILGLVFGIALGPCTFAYMAPMLVVVFRTAADHFVYATLLLLVYGIGHCGVIVVAGTSTELVQRFLNWNERSRGAVIVKRICGALVLVGGGLPDLHHLRPFGDAWPATAFSQARARVASGAESRGRAASTLEVAAFSASRRAWPGAGKAWAPSASHQAAQRPAPWR